MLQVLLKDMFGLDNDLGRYSKASLGFFLSFIPMERNSITAKWYMSPRLAHCATSGLHGFNPSTGSAFV